MKSFLDLQLEVLSKDADAGKWIDDFVKSDDPKFAGKSAEKRKQMALAAYYAKQKNEGVKQVRGDDSLQYEEVELDEASRAETGELFKSLVDKAHTSSQSGNHTQAKRHLANAQTARYGILAKHMNKHQASFDKYKELKHSYTNSDEPVREEVEELDELSKNTLGMYVKKAARDASHKSAMAQVYSQNFDKSIDMNRIANKRKKGIDKAVNKLTSEEAEELDELSNKLLNRYSKKAEKEAGKHFMAADRAQDRGNYDKAQSHMDKADKRASGVYRAQSKIKEESLDEISKDTLSSYAHKAFAQGNDLHYDLAHSKGDKATDAERQAIKDKISKRNAGVIKASQKMNKEDMDEAVDTVKRDEKGKVIAWSHEGDWEKSSTKNGGARGRGKAANLSDVARRKSEKLAKEEVEELDELSKGTLKSYVGKAVQSHGSNRVIANMAWDKSEKPGDLLDKLGHKSLKDSKKRSIGIAKAVDKLTKEEVEEFMQTEAYDQLDEVDKKTLGNYVNKAHDQLRQHSYQLGSRYAKDFGAAADHEDEYKRKENNRTQGIKTAVKKLTKEENLDELSKSTLGSYVKKASDQSKRAAVSANQSKHTASDAMDSGNSRLHDLHANNYRYSKNLEKKRDAGVDKAVNKLTKEDTMLTYSEFMAQLAEGKADDLRDKLAADRERRLDKYDYSKEKDSKVSPVKNVKGHSYGAGEDSEEGEDEVKTAKPAAAKRGRGRPAGSKSGARV